MMYDILGTIQGLLKGLEDCERVHIGSHEIFEAK